MLSEIAASFSSKRVWKLSVPSRISSKSLEKFDAILRGQVGDDAFYQRVGIDGAEAAFGRDGFWQSFTRVGFFE